MPAADDPVRWGRRGATPAWRPWRHCSVRAVATSGAGNGRVLAPPRHLLALGSDRCYRRRRTGPVITKRPSCGKLFSGRGGCRIRCCCRPVRTIGRSGWARRARTRVPTCMPCVRPRARRRCRPHCDARRPGRRIRSTRCPAADSRTAWSGSPRPDGWEYRGPSRWVRVAVMRGSLSLILHPWMPWCRCGQSGGGAPSVFAYIS